MKYLAWQGNEIVEREIPDEVPTCTPRQFRIALTRAGLRDQVEQAVELASQDVKDTWEFSTEIKRDNPMLSEMAQILSIADEQIDKLFDLAQTL